LTSYEGRLDIAVPCINIRLAPILSALLRAARGRRSELPGRADLSTSDATAEGDPTNHLDLFIDTAFDTGPDIQYLLRRLGEGFGSQYI
jgi:hypothetical protein